MRQGRSSDSGRNDWHRWKGSHHGLCSFCILQSPAHSRQSKSHAARRNSNSDARHTDKHLSANRTFIAALIAIKVIVNIAPISMYCFAAAFADIHIAALCTAYGTVILLLSTAADAAGYGAYRHLTIVVFAFQQRCNRVSILIVGIVVAVRRRLAVRFGIFSPLNRPQVRLVKARSDCLLDDASVQGFLVFQIRGIQTRLQQHIVLIAENLSRDARGCMEVLRVLVTDREENHADSIPHIGLAAAAVTAAF